MALCTVESVHRLSGSVGWVPTSAAAASDDYQMLKNKPSINGVELSGDLTLAQLGLSVETEAVGETITVRIVTGG